MSSHRMDAFRNITLPRLQLRQIVKIQSHIRGWLARNRRFKHKICEHIAAVQIIESMVTNYLEDKMIPNILIDIFRKNELFQEVGMYSPQN